MIDCHCHILPNLDDGSDSVEQSVKMAEVAVEEGITTIIVTPHHAHPYFETTTEDMTRSLNVLQEKLELYNIPLELLPGQEIRLFGDLIEHLALGKSVPLTGDGRYVLIEFPTTSIPSYSERIFYELAVGGYTPIIAHPERNKIFIDNPHKLFEFVKNGALTQITSSSLTGHFGKKIQSFTLQIIESNLAHILASDAHNLKARTFRMRESFDLLKEHFGTELCNQFNENAKQVLKNEFISVNPPEFIKKKKKLFSFFK
ncbi:tyrosine-protein phosphatase [Alkalicoccobacillus gibsonii]|uniref:tyrosine-protein phosphatase n=1 Tax=Alkalicoccobacillus gibsonii TaxID=79881 RepID=UPI00193271CF|nr:CpsB/CapC family capsule biosynthesis tyrosine phosphatase [Alkalicoccobacillus gibsonii]MBM0065891.1 tyrosine protein phosphatase [Alkalicoccobacillus gibsonii]